MLTPAEQARLRQDIASGSSRLSEIFDALSDNNRCQLFRACIKHSNLNVSELAAILHLSVPLTSQHLKVLTNSQLLVRRKTGREVFYHINESDPVVNSIVKAILP